MEYEAVIGLETHVQLKTKSKMWCGCANEFGAPPNTHVCPVCLGLPGVLPVANDEALRLTALTGCLLNCTIAAATPSSTGRIISIRTCRRITRSRNTTSPRPSNGYVEFEFNGGTGAGAHHPGAPRGGCGQELPFRAQQRRGFQPRRRAADGDRFRAGHHERGHGLRVSERAQGNPRLWRRERLRHGKGDGALRRERERAPQGHRRNSAPRSRSRT